MEAQMEKEEKNLVFSEDEFMDRIRRVRQSMEEEGVDLLLVHTPENIFYLTGYQTPGYYTYQCFALPLDQEPVMISRRLESTNTLARSWVENIATYEGVDDIEAKDEIQVTVEVMKQIGVEGKNIGIEKQGWFLSPANYTKILDAFPEEEFLDATDIVNDARVIKSTAEIEYIRQAARVAEKSMEMALQAIAAGKTDLDVAMAMMSGNIAAGGEYTGLPPFVAAGKNSYVTHATWERLELKPGDPIFLELPGCINRYHAALERTAVIEPVPEKWKEMAKVVDEALDAAIDSIRPGVRSGEVDAACRDVVRKAGYGEHYPHRCGYSIGIAFPPDWGEGHIMSLRENDPRELRAGMTFHIPPAIFIYGETAIGNSETVLVTDDSCEVITNFPRKLYVIDET
jgi:Xaa-Pro dipeptidase